MSLTVHRRPLEEGVNLRVLAGEGPQRSCSDCGEPAEVSLTYYDDNKWTPGEDLCWSCSVQHGPFDSDRAAEALGRPPQLRDDATVEESSSTLSNSELASAVRALDRQPEGEVWLAARLLRREDLPITDENLRDALQTVRSVTSTPEEDGGLFHELEARISQEWRKQAGELGGLDPAVSEDRAFWMLSWRDEEFVGWDLQPGDVGITSCDPTVRPGDIALLYRCQPASEVVAVLELVGSGRLQPIGAVTSLARAYECRFRVITRLEPPISLQELRADPELRELQAVQQNFRVSSIPIAPSRWRLLWAKLCDRQPAIRDRVQPLDVHQSGTPDFTSEAALEDDVVANLGRFQKHGLDLSLTGPEDLRDLLGRQPPLAGGGLRPDLICIDDSAGSVVVVELKNAPADPRDIGQLAAYVGWLRRSGLSRYGIAGVQVEGVLVSTRLTPQARAALSVTSALRHVSIGDLYAPRQDDPETATESWWEFVEVARDLGAASLELVSYLEAMNGPLADNEAHITNATSSLRRATRLNSRFREQLVRATRDLEKADE